MDNYNMRQTKSSYFQKEDVKKDILTKKKIVLPACGNDGPI